MDTIAATIPASGLPPYRGKSIHTQPSGAKTGQRPSCHGPTCWLCCEVNSRPADSCRAAAMGVLRVRRVLSYALLAALVLESPRIL